MPTAPAVHPYETLTTPTGQRVQIDTAMVSIIRRLWNLGYATTGCCQDVGEATAGARATRARPLGYGADSFIDYHRGWALLKLPLPDAMRLVAALTDTPAFAERVRRRWQPGSWRMNIPLEIDGLAPDALLHFPGIQIPQLAEVLQRT
ncbi:hypothetical protein [Streptomyces sp. NPDC006925]|uniref:hypothetical protein n=1 Tax=Streptomyces sp. NPDC006925 TaxID=3364768 RepID=UPI0036B768D8